MKNFIAKIKKRWSIRKSIKYVSKCNQNKVAKKHYLKISTVESALLDYGDTRFKLHVLAFFCSKKAFDIHCEEFGLVADYYDYKSESVEAYSMLPSGTSQELTHDNEMYGAETNSDSH
ncbi:hypothetical protein OE749_17375 [Aestuariibacter sp. AA17]|uniref:Uncharacterized protein n=1 Tax=Fluctibacter corallii TaxID=2984329 RepID=A0ABT3ACS4_9ALTE|nr:hypothetical protein [Aestuariibacter sp. AA17]MCV2886470.1 hypothetical protein [Aestuariibacter sp. AA17]